MTMKGKYPRMVNSKSQLTRKRFLDSTMANFSSAINDLKYNKAIGAVGFDEE